VKWILRYIKGTIDIGLIFKKNVAGNRSVSDMLILTMLETSTNAGPQQNMCLHYPKHQLTGTLLYSLLSHCILRRPSIWLEAMKEAICLQGFLDDLEIDQDLLKINCDSMSDIYLVKNLVYHAKTKHIDVRFHFIQEILDEGDI